MLHTSLPYLTALRVYTLGSIFKIFQDQKSNSNPTFWALESKYKVSQQVLSQDSKAQFGYRQIGTNRKSTGSYLKITRWSFSMLSKATSGLLPGWCLTWLSFGIIHLEQVPGYNQMGTSSMHATLDRWKAKGELEHQCGVSPMQYRLCDPPSPPNFCCFCPWFRRLIHPEDLPDHHGWSMCWINVLDNSDFWSCHIDANCGSW